MCAKLTLIFSATILASACSVTAQPGTVLWTYSAGSFVGTPALAPDGTIYTFEAAGNLLAITNTGSVASNKWTRAGGFGCPVIGPDGTIYYGDNGTNVSLNAVNPDGSQRWNLALQPDFPYQISFSSSVALGTDGTIYAVAGGYLYAVSSDGGRQWRHLVDGPSGGPCSPVVGMDGTIYVGSYEMQSFYAFTPAGVLKWSFPTPGNLPSDSPALATDGTIYFVSASLFAVSGAGTQLWSTGTNHFLAASPVIGADGTVYLGADPDRGLCAVTSAGAISWRSTSEPFSRYPVRATTPATGASGTIYYCVSNSVYAISPQGKVQWVVTAPGPPPPQSVLAIGSPLIGPDGTLYAPLGNTLYAIASGTNGPADSPWPMYRQNARRTGKVEKPVLQKPQKRADANFQFQLYPQQLGLTYTIHSSTNLNTWTSMTSFVATTFPTDVVDLTATNAPFRFYRASSPP
jgi:outer membrane protein assembly factor BamB